MNSRLKSILSSSDPATELSRLFDSGELKNIEPTLTALRMEIPVGYHHKDNFAHSLKVLNNSIAREESGTDLILRTAALFHDIGKPKTRQFEKNGVVTFVNHDLAGGKIVEKVLPKHGYSKDEVAAIAWLVRAHMRSHTFLVGWSDSAVRRLITDAGSAQQLKRVIVLFYSDATTKYEHKKTAIHNSVAQLESEIERIQKKDARKSLRPALNGNEVAELLNLKPGKELGEVMRLLNKDENVHLNREQATELILSVFSNR